MNLVFRVVRRKSDGQKVVASELAKSSVAGLSCTMALLSSLAMSGVARANTDIAIHSSSSATSHIGATVATRIYDLNTIVDDSPTLKSSGSNATLNAHLIDIVAPVAGVSHNKFTKFNVGTNGLILNNVSSGQSYNLSKETSLNTTGGVNELTVKVIDANSLFGSGPSAGLIINEVLATGGSRSNLQGFIEVAGTAANVVIANPYGITANGISFVNANRVTLATGSITGTPTNTSVIFDLTDSSLLIGENGNTSTDGLITATDLVLVSRAVKLNGNALATNALTVVSSDGDVGVNPNTGAVTTTASTSTTGSTYGIDSSALGGMYANTITLIANESGTGVRTLGSMAALGDKITITADGDLVVGATAGASTIEANSIALTSTKGNVSVTDAIVAAKTSSSDDTKGGILSITTNTGNLSLNGATLSSQTASDGSEGSLDITVTGDLGLEDSDLSGETITIDSSKMLTTDSTSSISARKSLAITAETIATLNMAITTGSGSSTIESTLSDITFGANGSLSGANVTIDTASNLVIESGASIAVSGNLSLIGATIDSAINISSEGTLTIGDADTTSIILGVSGTETLASVGGNMAVFGGTVSIFSDLAVTGSGVLTGNGANSTITINTQSNITAKGGLTVSGDTLTLQGDVVQPGEIAFNATGGVTIAEGASLITMDAKNVSLIAGGTIDNKGIVDSAGTLTVGNGSSSSNLTNTGTLQSVGNLNVYVGGTLYNQAVVASTQDGRNVGKLYDSSAETSAAVDTIEQALLINDAQIGLITTEGNLTLKAALTINEGDLVAGGVVNLTEATLRNQLAGIYGSSIAGVDGASTREALMGQSKQYNYVDSNGVESYVTDDYLLAGRANYVPSVTGASITGTVLNIGGKVTGNGAAITDIDISLQRVITTNTASTSEPDTTNSNVAITADAPIVANGNTNTSVELASNNATWVVNIAQPNASGLSNNTYSLLNINANGAIFNNMPFNQSVTVETDLSAVIVGNPTLTSPATVILNQVFSTGASKLNGFLEVAGKSADVLIVNPMGIVCDSCGSINVDRFDLVAGSVTLSDGKISALNAAVNDASVVVVGDGLDATKTILSSIIAPSITVGASLNAKKLYLGAGSGSFTRDVDSYSRTASSAAVNGSSLLVASAGGIFADNITIDSKVSGSSSAPLMRISGELAANAGDLNINTDGSMSITGRVSASRNVNLVTTSSSNSEYVSNADFQLINGAITSGNTMLLDVPNGSLVLNGGQIYSFSTLTMNGKTLIDDATNNSAEFNNTRFTKTDLTYNINDKMAIAGTSWEADKFLFNASMTPDLVVGESAVLKALTLIDMNLRSLENSGTVASLDQTDINATVSVGNLSAGIMTSKNSSSLVVPLLTNSGSWIGSETAPVSTNVEWQVNQITNNKSGVISSIDDWSITDFDSSGNETVFVNKGTVASDLALNANLSSMINGGKFTLSLRDSGQDSVWTINTLTNQVSGKLFAGDNWLVNADGVTGLSSRGDLLHNAGVMQGYQDLTLAFDRLDIAADTDISGGLKGEVDNRFTLAITDAVTLSGLIFSNADLNATFDNGLEVTTVGAIAANEDSTIVAGNIDNYGFLYAGQDLTLTSANNIGNFATVDYASGRTLGYSATNRRVFSELKQVEQARAEIRSGNSLSVTAAKLFVNSSEIRSGSALTVDASTISNQVQRKDNYDLTNPVIKTSGAKINYGSSETSEDFYTYPDNNTKFSKTETWNEFDYFVDGVPAVTPIMLAGDKFVLTAANVNNYGGVIESTAGNSEINVTTTLTNDSLSLHREDWKKVSTREVNYIALGPLTKGDTGWQGADPTSGVSSQLSSSLATINAVGSLAITGGGSVTNKGSYNQPYTSSDARASTSGQSALTPNSAGITVSLPTSPNGFFVTNKDPSAKYLVEMNPKLQSGVSTLGSDYLMESLNINTDTTMRRLGDASYEAYVVEQQLLEATGKSVLDGFSSTSDMMRGLMDNAVSQSGTMGLTFGKPLTEEQLASLDEPFVWMVEVEVNGQKVLAPKVYLPKRITEEIAQQQAIISADDLTMDIASLDNLGGNIEAEDNLTIASKGDINNISGGISGNNVSVTSTEGDINNETFNQYSGNENSGQTVIGKTATISANNNLALDAAGDITNLGAEMNAGNDASLIAGGDITFDTIEDESRSYELSGSSDGLSSTVSESREKTINQVKSGLNVGNNLSTESAGDTTFAGTDVNVGGNADIQADGEINIIARENSTEISTKTQTAGIGVGGGMLGVQTTTTDSLSIRNVGSTFNVGGDSTFTAAEDMTIQGSELTVGGDADIEAKGLNVLAGRDLDQSSTKTETATIGISIESEENVDGSNSEGVTFGQVTIETDDRLSQRSVGSNVGIGGNLTVKTQEDVVLQGSEVEAGGNVDIDAQDIRLLAAQNIETVSKSKTTTKIGLYVSTETNAEGEAGSETDMGYEYDAEQEGTGGAASASAGASAKAGASGSASASATLDLSRTRIDKEDTLSITNTGSAIRSGGDTKLQATNDLELVGSEIDAGGNVDLDAKNMTFAAAEDVYIEQKSSESIRVGLYADSGASGEAKASAEAKAEASAESGMLGASGSGEVSAEAGASAEGKAKAGMGIQTKVAKRTETEASTTAVTSMINSGGDITRTAEEKITDIGTNIEGAGSLNQDAAEWEFQAAQNTSSKTSSYEETTAKVGVYVEAGGEAEAKVQAKAEAGAGMGGGEASASASAKASAEGGAYAGVEVQVNRQVETEAERSTQAVVGSINMGGSVNSSSSGKTTFEGTNIEVGEDINLTASELALKAARDTFEKTTTSEEIDTRAAMKVGVGGSAEAEAKVSNEGGGSASAEAQGGVQVGAEMQASYDRLEETESSTTAVTSQFKGSNINLNTAGATTIEGANLDAENNINIEAESLDFTAAQNTFAASSNSQSVETEAKLMVSVLGAGGAKGGVSADVGIGESQEQGTEAVVGSINAGNLNITTTEKTRLEGTEVNVDGDATIDAGDIELAAAKSTFSASSQDISANMSFEASSSGSFEAEVGGGFANSSESSVESTAGTLNTGGNLVLKSKNDITLEGTDVSAGGDAVLAAANDVNVKAAYSTAESNAMEIEASVNVSKSGGGVEGSFAMESERSQTAKTGTISANNLTIVAGNNASFEGADVSAEGDVNLAAGNNVEFTAARNIEESSSFNVSAGIGSKSKGGGSDDEDDAGKFEASTKADDAPKKSSKEVEGNLGFGIGNANSNEAVTGGISGGNINIASGNNVSFEGTELAANDSVNIDAAGDVAFNKAESTSNSFGIGIELGGGTESETTTKNDGSSETENKAKVEAGVEFGIGSSNEQGGSQITAGVGGINVRSGGNVLLEGTQIETEGSANIEAEGDIEQRTVSSQSSEFGFSAKVEAEIPMEGSSTEATKEDSAESDGIISAADAKDDEAETEIQSKDVDIEKDVAPDTVKESESTADENASDGEAPAKDEDKKEEEEEEDGPEVKSQANMTFESESSSEGVSINAEGGVNLQSGTIRGQVAGTDQTVTARTRSDGTQIAMIPGAVGLPPGTEVALTGSNGEALPDWVSFDPLTGSISAKAPADFNGDLAIVVEVPQRDGSIKKIGVVVGQ